MVERADLHGSPADGHLPVATEDGGGGGGATGQAVLHVQDLVQLPKHICNIVLIGSNPGTMEISANGNKIYISSAMNLWKTIYPQFT